MPYEILQGYIVADSAVRAMPSITYERNPIRDLQLPDDAEKHLNKHWYLLNDYDPMRFIAFTRKKYPDAKNNSSRLYSELKSRMKRDSNRVYVVPSYILHIYVNNTIWIDTSDKGIYFFTERTSKTIAYCKVLDTLKGKVFPSLESAIFYNGEQSSNEDDGIVEYYALPHQTDVVFSYRDYWQRSGDRPLFDSNGEFFVEFYKV